jgi:hypothetical protein
MAFSVHRDGVRCDDPEAFLVRAIDEGGGAFIEIEQDGKQIRIDLEELEAVTAAARALIAAGEGA